MNADERRKAEQDLRDLLVALNHHSDRREYDRALALFAPGASFVSGPKTWTGHDELRRMFSERSPTLIARHLITNTMLTVTSPDCAEGISYYFALFSDPGPDPKFPLPLEPFSMGEWRDDFVRTADGWRIGRHEVVRLFMRKTKA